jgi:protein-L-isoaspartate(D-aspartate) O-methyltransferase
MNATIAQENMIKQQLKTCKITDEVLLHLIEKTPRDFFVPNAYQHLAYADMMLPIGHGQKMMLPSNESQMLQVLNLKKTDRVLEIGTGTGYITALLAKLAHHVVSVDIFPDFIQTAETKLKAIEVNNVTLQTLDVAQGYSGEHEFDCVVITGGLPFLPQSFKVLLKPNGRLFAVVGEAPTMQATLWTLNNEQWQKDILFETEIPFLLNALTQESFIF